MSKQTPELAIISLLIGHTLTTDGTWTDRILSFPILRMLEEWSRRVLLRREMRRILETDNHLLDDVGIDADGAAGECRRHFWQSVVLKQRCACHGDDEALSLRRNRLPPPYGQPVTPVRVARGV
jgi:uncharacterized protein YjiS (DUF1127 family)